MRIAIAYLVAACGGGGQSPPEAGPPGPDVPLNLEAHHYVMDTQVVPQNNSQARELGIDLNGDQTIDNQLGMVTGTLAGQGLDTQTSLTTNISRGDILMLAEFSVDNFIDSTMTFTLFSGANPQPPACNGAGDTVCRRHLDGLAQFDIAANSARDTALLGVLSGGTGTTEAGGGHLQLQTTMLTTTPISLDLIGARVKILEASVTSLSGVIGGALTETQLDTKVLPAMQQSFQASVELDCPNATLPDCACTEPSSTGDSMLGLFDTTPKDCAISLDEVKNNSLIQSLLAPDVTVEGQNALSLGIGFTAVPATFTP